MAPQKPRHTLCPKLDLAMTSTTRGSTRLATSPSSRTDTQYRTRSRYQDTLFQHHINQKRFGSGDKMTQVATSVAMSGLCTIHTSVPNA